MSTPNLYDDGHYNEDGHLRVGLPTEPLQEEERYFHTWIANDHGLFNNTRFQQYILIEEFFGEDATVEPYIDIFAARHPYR